MSDMPDIEFALDYLLDDRARELYHRAVWVTAQYLVSNAAIPWLCDPETQPDSFHFAQSCIFAISETFGIPWDNVSYDISLMRAAIRDPERAFQRPLEPYDTPETAGAKAAQARRVADMFQHVFGRGDGRQGT